jgi:membrane-associated phospholipid phosphatase
MRHRPATRRLAAPEALESRQLLDHGGRPARAAMPSSGAADLPATPGPPAAITLALDPAADPVGEGVVFRSRVTVAGQAAPHARVRIDRGADGLFEHATTANASGRYRFDLRVGPGVTPVRVVAADSTGHRAAADLDVTCADPVLAWNAAALQAIRLDRTPPPQAARALAIVHTAVDAAVGALIRAPRGVRVAAASAAADRALDRLFPDQAARFDAALDAALAGLPAGPAVDRGVARGRAAAEAVLARRGTDGADATVSYVPGAEPGRWRPTPPGLAAAVLPQWPRVTPFALTTAAQFRPPGHPALTGTAYAAALREVQEIGRVDSTTRTPEQTQVARFWADGAGTVTPPGHWNQIAAQVALRRPGSLARNARLFARLNVALADAGIAAWDAKYIDDCWRPITAIRRADADGNPLTAADPGWEPLLATPAFPSYVSGHSAFSAAAAAVLTATFGPRVRFTTGSDALPGVTRTFDGFAAAAAEAGRSRIYGGIHFAFDNDDGLALGRAVGHYVVQTAGPIRAPARSHPGPER